MSPIDEVREKTDIVALIATSGVNLRKTGRAFVGFCPFHPNTRTPAFTVYPDSQSFHCFGCKASGTAFDYVMRKQGLDFREALEELARQAGVRLEPRNPEEAQQDQLRTRLLEINSLAARYFNHVLLQMARGEPGRAYLGQRGLDAPTIEAFQLGYSLDEWSHLLNYLTERKGFSPEEVVAAGLAIHHESRGFYDRFRGRVIFPIRNSKGEVIGFGGRALGDGQPKYLNSPQTALFDKSNVLYGLDLARDAIRSQDAAIVVEGYLDVITAHQFGFRNVVAPLGTALTKGHVALIKKLSPNLFLALDADAAGQKATLRGLQVIGESEQELDGERRVVATAAGTVRLENEVRLRIIRMPEGRDPDEVIRADSEQWRALVQSAAPVMDFYIEAFTSGLDLSDGRGQGEALTRLLPLLAELDNTSQRAYISTLERALGMRAELILDALREFVARQRGEVRRSERRNERSERSGRSGKRGERGEQRGAARPNSAPEAPAREQPAIDREAYLLGLFLNYPAISEPIEGQLRSELANFSRLHALFGTNIESLLERPELRGVFAAWLATPLEERPERDELATWANRLPEPLRSVAHAVIAMPNTHDIEFRFRPEAERIARQLRHDQARRWHQRLLKALGDAEPPEDHEEHLRRFSDLLAFAAHLREPRRSSSFQDLRDLQG